MPLRHYSASPFEQSIGFCRAIRVGNTIEVAGTASIGEQGELIGEGSCYEQTRFILEKIEKAVTALGGRKEHIVRTRMFVADGNQWPEVARAHSAFFEGCQPASTLVQAGGFVEKALLVEIEASAIVSEE
jgi:enamine deaminase RidA (YjgF/YER057c/UK114 family)